MKFRYPTVCLLFVSAWSGASWAIEQERGFSASASIAYGRDNNVNAASSLEQNVESNFTDIRLTANYLGDFQSTAYMIDYIVDRHDVEAGGRYDSTNQYFLARSRTLFTPKHRLNLRYKHDRIEVALDSINRNDTSELEGNRSKADSLGARYVFGAIGARANLSFGAAYEERRYLNNLRSSSRNIDKDRDAYVFDADFYYEVAPKTKIVGKLKYSDYDYVESTSPLDNEALLLLAGVEWNRSETVTASVLLGVEDKDFDRSGGKDTSSAGWKASLNWSPIERAQILFETARGDKEGSVREDFIDVAEYAVSWRHQWLERLDSVVQYKFIDRSYGGGPNNGREDEVDNFRVNVSYKFRRWLDVTGGFRTYDQASNRIQENYERDVYSVGIKFEL